MTSTVYAQAITLPVAVLVMIWAVDREIAGEDVLAANNPVASAAWAQSNCHRGLIIASDAAPSQAEILLDVAAGFESERSHKGAAAACRKALRFARKAVDPRSLPSDSGSFLSGLAFETGRKHVEFSGIRAARRRFDMADDGKITLQHVEQIALRPSLEDFAKKGAAGR